MQNSSSKIIMNQEIIKKIDTLIKNNPVLLFCKGTPEQPRCGFTAQAMEILIEQWIFFETYDILKDEALRQTIKEYKKWPTFPQLYIHNELVGGVDIMEEMLEEGEFEEISKSI